MDIKGDMKECKAVVATDPASGEAALLVTCDGATVFGMTMDLRQLTQLCEKMEEAKRTLQRAVAPRYVFEGATRHSVN